MGASDVTPNTAKKQLGKKVRKGPLSIDNYNTIYYLLYILYREITYSLFPYYSSIVLLLKKSF